MQDAERSTILDSRFWIHDSRFSILDSRLLLPDTNVHNKALRVAVYMRQSWWFHATTVIDMSSTIGQLRTEDTH